MITYYDKNNNSQMMIQFVDISKSIRLDHKIVENNMLGILNATVSHELRNPLSSINAQIEKKKTLCKKIKEVCH